MASERARFIAELIAALQENEELSSSAPSPSSASAAASSRPATAAAAAPPRPTRAPAAGLTSAAFSDESDDADDEQDAQAAVFTGFFQESWVSTRASSSPSSSSSLLPVAAEKNAREAHEKLQFDFPQIADAQLLALAESYRQLSQSDSHDSTAKQTLPVTMTLVEGIVYLTDKSAGPAASTGSRSSEASGLLAASVLLLLFEHCLRHSDDIRTRALLGKLQVPVSQSGAVKNVAPDHSMPPSLMHQKPPAGDEDAYVEVYAAEEDPDDLSQVYEGDFPVMTQHQKHDAPLSNTKSGSSFTEKLQLIATRTFSSSITSISTAKWDEWAIDRCLFGIMEQLLSTRATAPGKQPSDKKESKLFSHNAQGEWTRYLYILRDRILRFPNASRSGIFKLKDLVELLQPRGLRQWNASTSNIKKTSNGPEAEQANVEIQLPHHLVYRVLAELVLSKELQSRSSQPAQRELASVLQGLLPLIIQEIQRLGASRQATNEDARADESDDLILILIQLTHFLLFASPSKRVTADKLQESGFLRTLLTLVPVDLMAAQVTMSTKRFWFTPLLRLIAECALWNVEFAEYIARVSKFVALLPDMRSAFPAEFALLVVALHQHQLHEFAALQALTNNADRVSLWDELVCKALFPLTCGSYLESMAKERSLQDAVYFLECVIDALGGFRTQLLDDIRSSLQRIYSTFTTAFEYPSFSAASSLSGDIVNKDGLQPGDDKKVEERGQAESLQFLTLRNKLRQCTKTILLTNSMASGPQATSGAAYSSSKLD